MNQQKVSLTQLRALAVLLREPNLSRAAEILGVSQPTLSATLKQLREQFDDPLLVRAGNQMQLTAKARALMEPIDHVFEAVDQLWKNVAPEPGLSRRQFLVGCSDYAMIMVGSALRRQLREEAPHVQLRFVDLSEAQEGLLNGNKLDFHLIEDSFLQSPVLRNLKFFPLWHDEMVLVVDEKHRLAEATGIKQEEFADESFVAFHLHCERIAQVSRGVDDRINSRYRVAIQVPQFSVIPSVVASSDLIGIIPRRLAEHNLPGSPLRILDTAERSPSYRVCLVWDEANQSDPMHTFMRGQFKKIVEA